MTNSGTLTFTVSCGSPNCYASSTASYNDNQWYLATATLGPTGQRLYVDGVQVGSNANTSQAPVYSGYWRVGYANLLFVASRPTSDFFTGSLAFASIYSSQLTVAQIGKHYAANS